MPASLRLKAGIIDFLGARCFGRMARKRGFTLNHRFLGVYDFQGGAAVYAGLLRQWLRLAGEGDAIMCHPASQRSEEHTSELQSLMRISYAVFCLKKKNK